MPLKVLEWIKCLDLAQQALLIIFSQTTTTRLSKELLGCNWPDTTSRTQGDQKLVDVHSAFAVLTENKIIYTMPNRHILSQTSQLFCVMNSSYL